MTSLLSGSPSGSFKELAVQSFKYTLKDKRKLSAFFVVILIVVIGNLWHFIPQDIPFPYYGSLDVFIYNFSNQFQVALAGVAWFLIVPRRDFALQILSMGLIAYGAFMTFSTLPLTLRTPLWIEITCSLLVFCAIVAYLYYIQNNYVNKRIDYKHLHDNIVHDLHHQRFLNHLSRAEGIIDISDMPEPYKSMSLEELSKVKEAIHYISIKYAAIK